MNYPAEARRSRWLGVRASDNFADAVSSELCRWRDGHAGFLHAGAWDGGVDDDQQIHAHSGERGF